MKNYLEFEKEIKALEQEVDGLKSPFGSEGISEVDTQKIKNTQNEINEKLKETYANLNSWQRTQVARHEDRPKANFYIKKIFSQFTLLSGDRYFGDDKSVIAGFGLIDNKSILVIGQEKGEDLNSRIERNFGMMRPEGYRKCIRLMKLADRFQIPVVSFIDTPGAYPGIDAESRNQSIAIADNLYQMSKINTPIISVVIGEGGSGGALAIGVADRLAMLQYSIYSVISPEGCASILWKDASKANIAAEELSITSGKLLGHKLIDRIIPEPHGAAHRNYAAMYSSLKSNILDMLQEVNNTSHSELLKNRNAKLMSYGQFES